MGVRQRPTFRRWRRSPRHHDQRFEHGQPAWGIRNNNGLFRVSNFRALGELPRLVGQAAVTASTPLDTWGVQIERTATIDWREYAAAFSDVDPDFEMDFGIIDDGLKALYYELVVKGVAAGGNLFRHGTGKHLRVERTVRLGRPLARFTNWGASRERF